MSNKITFGENVGKTFEWLFFSKPWYAEWMFLNRIHRDRNKFDEDDSEYFSELMHRANHLAGICPQCEERPITRMGLSTHQDGTLGAVGFYCDQCEYTGGSRTEYCQPSFFVDTHTLPRCEQLRIVSEIKNQYLGQYERVSQKRMKEFFENDTNFQDATPGFFQNIQNE